MIGTRLRQLALASLGTSATLVMALGLSGCGGSGNETSEAVVVTEPGSSLPTTASGSAPPSSTAPAATPTTASTPAATTPAATPAPAATAKAEGWGTLKGQVVFGSAAPPQEILIEQGKAPKDPEVCAKAGPIKAERLVVDGATKGVKNVLVYLVKPSNIHPDAKAAAAKAQVVFDQKNCIFEPHVLAIQSGAKIELKSSDPVNHNVNAKFKSNSPFNSLLAAGQSIPYSPAAAERTPAQVTCDIHPWMLAYWMVLDHPYFAVTDDKGNFEIKNVPAGASKVVVWHEAAGFVTPNQGDDVSVAANGTESKTFTVDPGKIRK
ncbi:MAG: carboxypeptidase regulatory-like domain-containing protein [Isosphaeraceae bacterium]